MMRLGTYAGLSFLGVITVIYHAFNSREQFYPTMVYLSTSKLCLVLLLNMGLVVMCILWQLVKHLFLGSLREAEVERLNEQAWREVIEILFIVTIFRQDFSVGFLAMVTSLLMIKALHWLAQRRVEYIETTPSVSVLSHIRIASFIGFLLVLDCLFFYSSMKSLIRTQPGSLAFFFSFEYMILATTTISTFIKYIFYVKDMLMEGQWERKAVYTFYLELVFDLFQLSMYLCYFLYIFMNHTAPFYLIHEFYTTLKNFKIRVADYIRYRKITSNMNERFPDATTEELNASDATCIICREEMVTAKKLLCGHLFHVHCLRSWLERQHTCPTCRSVVVPSENGLAGTGRQHGLPSQPHESGSGAEQTSTPGLIGGARGNLSPHQIRLQAAASAAAVYQKSLAHSPADWFPGYALPPQASIPATEAYRGESSRSTGETSPSRQTEQQPYPTSSGNSHFAFLQVPQYTLLPLQAPNVPASLLEAHQSLIRQQIEVLQTQLQLLQQQRIDMSASGDGVPAPPSDCKGKTVANAAAAVASTSDCGRHGDVEEVDTD